MNQVEAIRSTGIGERLARAREAAGLDVQAVSTRLRMPARIVQALEAEDFARLGAAVFVRGQLQSYARLLDVDISDLLAAAADATPVARPLVSHTHTPRARRVFDQAMRRGAYIAITAAILVPIWLATQPHLVDTLAVDTLEPQAEPAAQQDATPRPVVASMASIPRPAPASPELRLAFDAPSWVEIFAADGSTIERGEIAAGQSRAYRAADVGRVVIGNAGGVRVTAAGRPVDAGAFSRANVARFTLSSAGSVTPVND